MKKRIVTLLLLVLCFALIFSSVVFAADDSNKEIYATLDDLEGKSIGILNGTIFDQLSEKQWENPNLVYEQDTSSAVLALKEGKIDAYISDGPYARYTISQNDDLTYIDESMDDQYLALAYAKNSSGQALKNEMDSFIVDLEESGELESLLDTWVDSKSQKPDIDIDSLDGSKGTLLYGTDCTNTPFDYTDENNQYAGFEVNIMYLFCKEAGYKLEILDMSFDSLIPSLVSGKVDVIGGSFAITEEREESVYFSEPICKNEVVAVITKDHAANDSTEDTSLISSLKTSFTKTFIDENRWKMFVSGIKTTLLITLCSLILGTILGFVLYMWLWTGNKVAKIFTDFYSWLMNRLPMVIILMILFMLIFAKSKEGTFVAIIGFTLAFGATVLGLIQSGVRAVDPGQQEAGLALGYTRIRTFFKIVLPQAIRQFMPAYKGEVVSLIKGTAIVGYVAVKDLTKMSDIIRSKTFDAFFPLITTAIIYIILAEILILLVNVLDKKLFPARRTEEQIMKGVKTND